MSDENSQCEKCQKPLGQESKDLGFKLCHNCRECITCQKPVNVVESNYCLEKSLPIQHARCMKVTDGQSLSIQVDIANAVRLITSITLRIGDGSFDEKFVWLRTLQENAAQVSILVNRDRKSLKTQLDAESSKKEQKKTEETRRTVQATQTKVERKHLTDAAKAIKALTSVGVPYPAAANTILAQEIKKGRTPQVARETVLEAMISLGTPKDDVEKTLDGRLN